MQVGVLGRAPGGQAPGGQAPGGATPSPTPAPGSANATELRLRRTGGLAGRAVERTVSLDELAPDLADGWRSLLAGDRLAELAAVEPLRPVPDAFTYHVACPPLGGEVALAEHAIPEPVRDLFVRTLRG